MAANPRRIASCAGGLDDKAVRADAAVLFERHRTVVEGVCRPMLRNPGEAQDAAQQAYLAAYQALLAGSRPHDGEAWLATIARHECLRRIRLRMREPLQLADEPADRSAYVHEQAVSNAAATLLWQEIGRLPPQQRDAVVLREFGGRSYVQVAAELGVSTPAVESLLFRARSRLRARLQAALSALNLAPLAPASAGVLARLFGGDVAPRLASPLVAKGAAITAGLAMLGGGAVATERHLDRAVSGAAPPHAAPVSPRTWPVAAAVAPKGVVHLVARHARSAAPLVTHVSVRADVPAVSVRPEPVVTTVRSARAARVSVPARAKPAPARAEHEPQAPVRSAPAAVPPRVDAAPAPGDDGRSPDVTPEVDRTQPSSGGGSSHEGEGSGHGDSGSGSGGSSGGSGTSGGSGSSGHGGQNSESTSSGDGGSPQSGGGDGAEVGTPEASIVQTSDDPSAESSGPDEPDGSGGESSGEGSGGPGSGDDGGHGGDSFGDDGHSGPGGG